VTCECADARQPPAVKTHLVSVSLCKKHVTSCRPRHNDTPHSTHAVGLRHWDTAHSCFVCYIAATPLNKHVIVTTCSRVLHYSQIIIIQTLLKRAVTSSRVVRISTRCHAVAGTTARCALCNECTNPNPATNLIPVHNLQ